MSDWPTLRTMAAECRGEPEDGQQAVAHVLLNRLADGRWGKTLASVCLWNAEASGAGRVFQFSGWRSNDPNFAYVCGLRDDDPVLVKMASVLQAAASGPDITNGALYYFSERISPPSWASVMRPCGTFGSQLFFSDRPARQALVA